MKISILYFSQLFFQNIVQIIFKSQIPDSLTLSVILTPKPHSIAFILHFQFAFWAYRSIYFFYAIYLLHRQKYCWLRFLVTSSFLDTAVFLKCQHSAGFRSHGSTSRWFRSAQTNPVSSKHDPCHLHRGSYSICTWSTLSWSSTPGSRGGQHLGRWISTQASYSCAPYFERACSPRPFFWYHHL